MLVKFGLKIPNCLGKMSENLRGGDFLSHTVHWCYLFVVGELQSRHFAETDVVFVKVSHRLSTIFL